MIRSVEIYRTWCKVSRKFESNKNTVGLLLEYLLSVERFYCSDFGSTNMPRYGNYLHISQIVCNQLLFFFKKSKYIKWKRRGKFVQATPLTLHKTRLFQSTLVFLLPCVIPPHPTFFQLYKLTCAPLAFWKGTILTQNYPNFTRVSPPLALC